MHRRRKGDANSDVPLRPFLNNISTDDDDKCWERAREIFLLLLLLLSFTPFGSHAHPLLASLHRRADRRKKKDEHQKKKKCSSSSSSLWWIKKGSIFLFTLTCAAAAAAAVAVKCWLLSASASASAAAATHFKSVPSITCTWRLHFLHRNSLHSKKKWRGLGVRREKVQPPFFDEWNEEEGKGWDEECWWIVEMVE